MLQMFLSMFDLRAIFDATPIWPMDLWLAIFLYIPIFHGCWLPMAPPLFLQVIFSSSFCWGVAPKWRRRKSSTCRGLRYGGLSWFIPQKNAGIVGRWCDIVWYNFTKMGIKWRLGVLFGVTIVGYTAWTCTDGALYLIHTKNSSIWICQ